MDIKSLEDSPRNRYPGTTIPNENEEREDSFAIKIDMFICYHTKYSKRKYNLLNITYETGDRLP